MPKFSLALVGVATALALSGMVPAHAAVDETAALALMKKNDCAKCHAVDKSKKGPSWQKTAAKYKGKADAQDKVVKAISTGTKVKMDDGTEEEHKIVDTKDPAALKNLADWILAH